MLHPLLAARWSPTTFDGSYELAAPEIEALLEAARWAPSAGNSQPWAFIVGQRGDATHTRLTRYLAVAHMTVQAQALGLHVRQFRAFDRAGLAAEFGVPGHWEVTTMAALGRAGQAHPTRPAPEPRPTARRADALSRQRRSIDDILWPVT